MAQPEPTLDEWRRLYQAASRLKEVAPWEWMRETDILGVQNPETGELGFVSLMGMMGEHLALALYLGPQGLHEFWVFEEVAAWAPSEHLLEIPHLMASFEDRNELGDRDRQVIKDLGLKFRGRMAWPWFRSYCPGLCPWYLEAAEARFLTHAIEQAVDVALRVKENPAILDIPGEDSYLVRVPREQAGALVWEDQVMTVPPPEPETVSIPMDIDVLEGLKRLPQSGLVLEVDFFLVPICIGERGTRPYYPYMLLSVDSDSGMILGSELLQPEPNLRAMWGRVPVTLVHQLAGVEIVPRRIKVRTPLLAQLLELLGEDLKYEVDLTSKLPTLDRAKKSLLTRFV